MVASPELLGSDGDGRVKRYGSIADLPDAIAESMCYSRRQPFFASSDWYECLHRSGFPEHGELRLYVCDQPARAGGAASLFALFLLADPGGHRLRNLANYYTVHFLCPRSGTVEPASAVAEILRSLKQHNQPGLELELRNLPEHDSGTAALIAELPRAGLMTDVRVQYANWYGRTEGLGFTAYMSRRPRQLQNTLRRRQKKLERDHTVHFRLYDSVNDVEQGLREYLRVYERSWKQAEKPRDFIPELIRLSAKLGIMRLGILYADGVPVAAQFWIKDGSTAYIYKLAYDPDFSGFSVGSLLTARLFEHAIDADGVEEIDFGTGNEAYKRDWVDCRRSLLTVHAVAPYSARGAYLGLRWRIRGVLERLRVRTGRRGVLRVTGGANFRDRVEKLSKNELLRLVKWPGSS